ncbi:MAG: SET domain-containing protein-lysine N-methyltransferase [Planctomycetota bacterium]
MSPFISVQPSSIHGRGLFAARNIPAGTHLGQYEGPQVLAEEEESLDMTYVLWVWDDEDNVFGIDGRNELRYVNHSGRPNVEFVGADLYTLRDISLGEELTHHYGEDWPEEG